MTATVPEIFADYTGLPREVTGEFERVVTLDEEPRTARVSQPPEPSPVMDEVLGALEEMALPPSGAEIARGVIDAIRRHSPDAPLEIVQAEDGGAIIEIEYESNGREVSFVVPADGTRRYFSASSDGEFVLAGAVAMDLAIGNLVRWASGAIAAPSRIGLILP